MDSEPGDNQVVATVAAYDRHAAAYAHVGEQTTLVEHRRWLESSCELRTAAILDAGCGCGRDVEAFRRSGYAVVGLDMSKGMLQQAADFTSASLVQGDVRRFPFASASFAGVWSAAVLTHLPHAAMPDALAEMRRILKDGAPAFLSLRTGGADGWQPFRGVRRWYSHWSAEAALPILALTGFKVESALMEADAAARADIRWLAIRAYAAK